MDREGREKMGSPAGSSFWRGGPDGHRLQTSGGRRRLGCSGRCTAEDGELGGLTGIDFRFLGRRRTATGDAPRVGKMQTRAESTVCCTEKFSEGFR
jgi:hypothetical protein